MKLLIMQCSQISCHFLCLTSKIQKHILKRTHYASFLLYETPIFTPTENNCHNIYACILIFTFLDSRLEDKRFQIELQQ
jgi:hypothetical protein